MEKFKALGLSDTTLSTLVKKGFEEPTEIQALTIPLMLNEQKDIIAQAQTGTGKTAAFALPLIEKLDPRSKVIQAIILAPTRELVIQICEEINSLKSNKDLRIAPIYGGQSIQMQLKKLKQGVSIVVGTPGRLLDHISRKSLKLQNIKYFILDEADEMLNMGFIEDIEDILAQTPKEKRVMLFSATMPSRIKSLAQRYMSDYEHVKTKTNLTTNLTDQIYFEVSHKDKFEALCRIVDMEPKFYGIVFCRTKVDVDTLVSHLYDRGYLADALHGDISQDQREKVLNKFRRQKITVLVATDVAARGIDVNNLTHVINFAIPQNPEAYVHRIGRTGRAGNQGTAITFITPSEFRQLNTIERVTKSSIRKVDLPNVDQIIKAKRESITEEIQSLTDKDVNKNCRAWASQLLSRPDAEPEDVMATVLQHVFGKDMDKNNYKELTPPKRGGRRERKGRDLIEEEGKTRLFIAKGSDNKLTKSGVVDYIVKNAGISASMINGVEVSNKFSFITVPFAEAEQILKVFKKKAKGKLAVVVKAKASPSRASGRGSRGGRGQGGKNRRRK